MLTQTSKKINLSNQKCLNYFRLRFGVFVTKKPMPTTCAETLESLDFASSSSLASSPDLQPSSVRPWVWLWHRWCMDGCWRGCPGAVGESFAKILQRGKVFYETNKTTKGNRDTTIYIWFTRFTRRWPSTTSPTPLAVAPLEILQSPLCPPAFLSWLLVA